MVKTNLKGGVSMARAAFIEAILAHSKTTPDKLALVDESDSLTYLALKQAIDQLTSKLTTMNFDGKIVALQLPRGIKFSLMVLALTKLKITFIPQDITQPTERLNDMIKFAGVQIIVRLTDNDYSFEKVESAKKTQSSAWAIYFTSGSTGNPKGVEVPFRTLENTTVDQVTNYKLTPNDRVASFTPYSFVVSYYDLFSTLYAGASLYVVSETVRHSLTKLEHYMRDNKITFMNASTMIGEIMMRSMQLPSLRLLNLAGQRFPDVDTSKLSYQVINVYGNTECAVATICRARPHQPVTIGQAVHNMHTLILDGQQQVIPDGEIGELFVYGIQVTDGYFLNEKATKAAFTTINYHGKPIWGYRTGDYAKVLPNGEIEYEGRRDSQYKINGVRIDLNEVGSICERVIADLKQCYLAVKDNHIYCWVTSKQTINETQVLTEMAAYLPPVMMPIGIKQMAEFPLNLNGKIDERRLLSEWQTTENIVDERQLSANQLANEQYLKQAWSEVLNVETTQINYQSDFKRLGATSLQFMELGVKILDERGKQLNFVDLHYHSTLAEMAELLEKPNSYQPIYTFVPRTATMGDNPALFVIHSGNTGSDVYRPLFTDIEQPNFPIYVIEPHNLLAPKDQINGIENIAAYYLKLIEGFEPEQNVTHFKLMGWSYGGVVASEMVYQLEHATSSVPTVDELALLDAPFYLNAEDLQQVKAREANGYYAKYFTETHIFEGLDKKNITTARLIANNHQVCEDLFVYQAKPVQTPTIFVRSMVEDNPLTDEQIQSIFINVKIEDVYSRHDYLFVEAETCAFIQRQLHLTSKEVGAL